MERFLLVILSALYALAAWAMWTDRSMRREVVAMLTIPLALSALFYLAAIVMPMPHWAVAASQSLYLLAIILIQGFTRKDNRK